ncbi:MAG TPA: hypothetical protein VNA04_06650 [Thermoanaerobaculia bacterium]|nr:hypothetical protein [Thermoanaerobaculia bacterium]
MARTLQTLTREEAIARLRSELIRLTDVENSICKVAAERGIFCEGFHRYTDEQLRQRYDWIVAKNPDMTRDELERIANDWQLARQEVSNLPIACDVQQRECDTCRGWNDFTTEQLARFYYQITGQEIAID